jgi:large subunit ribosomal protein L4
MEIPVYNQQGEQTGKVDLPDHIFNMPWNVDLVHQVAVSMQANARKIVAHTKSRGEVRGGGAKPWRQKGTGRARHGSIRSPLWRGGGVTFGPRKEKVYSRKINKKMRAKALLTVLSQKLREKEVILVDKFDFTEPKTKEAKATIKALSVAGGFGELETKRKNKALIAMSKKSVNTEKSFRNFGNIKTGVMHNLNVGDALKYKYLIITQPEEAIEFLEQKYKIIKTQRAKS